MVAFVVYLLDIVVENVGPGTAIRLNRYLPKYANEPACSEATIAS